MPVRRKDENTLAVEFNSTSAAGKSGELPGIYADVERMIEGDLTQHAMVQLLVFQAKVLHELALEHEAEKKRRIALEKEVAALKIAVEELVAPPLSLNPKSPPPQKKTGAPGLK